MSEDSLPIRKHLNKTSAADACADDTTATTNNVVVDIDEYFYKQQKDHKRNDREKKLKLQK